MNNIHFGLPSRQPFQRSANVVPFRRSIRAQKPVVSERLQAGEAFSELTGKLVMARHTAGTLDPEILRALLLGAGIRT